MNQTEQKTYVPKSSAKLVKFQSGKSIIKLGFHAETMAAFLREHANAKGYVNLGISERRSVGERGDTHCVWLDTWQPGQPSAPKSAPMSPEAVKEGLRAVRAVIEKEDVPF